MNEDEIREKIATARRITQVDPQDPLTQIAFKEVLRLLLSPDVGASQISYGKRDLTLAIQAQRMQVNEFLATLRNLKTETDRVVAILYHYLHNDFEAPTRSEILQAYDKARIPKPKNLSDVVARCMRKGHVVQAMEPKDGQRAWKISATGETHVEETLRG